MAGRPPVALVALPCIHRGRNGAPVEAPTERVDRLTLRWPRTRSWTTSSGPGAAGVLRGMALGALPPPRWTTGQDRGAAPARCRGARRRSARVSHARPDHGSPRSSAAQQPPPLWVPAAPPVGRRSRGNDPRVPGAIASSSAARRTQLRGCEGVDGVLTPLRSGRSFTTRHSSDESAADCHRGWQGAPSGRSLEEMTATSRGLFPPTRAVGRYRRRPWPRWVASR